MMARSRWLPLLVLAVTGLGTTPVMASSIGEIVVAIPKQDSLALREPDETTRVADVVSISIEAGVWVDLLCCNTEDSDNLQGPVISLVDFDSFLPSFSYIEVKIVPEPATALLVGSSLTGLALARRGRTRSSRHASSTRPRRARESLTGGTGR